MTREPPVWTLGARLRHLASCGVTLAAGALSRPFLPWLRRSRRFRALPARLLSASRPVQAGLIHVLGGDHRGAMLRVDHATALFRRGLAPRILLTGSGGGVDWARTNRRRALELGVPDSALIVDSSPTSTRSEARMLRRMALDRRIDSVILVTEAVHAGRAARIVERTLRGTGVTVHSCPADLEGFPPAGWWEDPALRGLVLGEVVRLILARATGGA